MPLVNALENKETTIRATSPRSRRERRVDNRVDKDQR
jgi:hypothetical protein